MLFWKRKELIWGERCMIKELCLNYNENVRIGSESWVCETKSGKNAACNVFCSIYWKE